MYLKRSTLTVTDTPPFIHGERLDVVVAYADLRGFSQWSLQASASQVTRVLEIIYDRVIQLAFFYKHTFHKFLGDGFVLVWEVVDHGSFQRALFWALGASFEIHKKYWYLSKRLQFDSPPGFGIGLACGSVIRIDPETFVPELNEPDFVGYPMNCGARLQNLAGPFGTVLDSTGVRYALEDPDHVLRRQNPILRLELHDPSEKSLTLAHRLTGMHAVDLTGYKYVTWPYVQHALWRIDGFMR